MAKVLLVDDDPSILELLKEFLSGKGYEVQVAENGKQALQAMKVQRPDVVLLDIQMPEMDGLTTLRSIKALDKDVGVIMISGVRDGQICKQALTEGAFDYVVKPFDFDYLEKTLWWKIKMMVL